MIFDASTIEAFVVSWTGQHDHALAIADGLRGHVAKVTIVYSDADDGYRLPGETPAVRVPNDWYWGRKFETALRACGADLMLVVQADASTSDWAHLVERCLHCFNACAPTGVWAPKVDYSWFSLDRTLLGNVDGDSLKIVAQTDGIVFAIPRGVQDRLRELDYSENTYGWGIDWAAAAHAYANRMLALVDTSVEVTHPKSRGYDSDAAMRQMQAFLQQLDPFENVQFLLLDAFQRTARGALSAPAAPRPVEPAPARAAAPVAIDRGAPGGRTVRPLPAMPARADAPAALDATRPGGGPRLVVHDSMIDYADGSERALMSIVTAQDFCEDTSWREHPNQWALYYHLSPLRRNVFGMLDLSSRPLDVLELGAGCGAITSGLVGHDNLRVTAVEGAIDRARVIEARCRRATNLEIHACNIDRFAPGRTYDVVTLIGVLEYAGRYTDSPAPFDWLLARARSFLKDDGVLVLAIENQMGHKYLAGSPEDHYEKPYEGVNGYPNYSGVMTFDRDELAAMLARNGFPAARWFYPYPDYKMPVLLFSQDALDDPSFDWIAMTRIPPEPNMIDRPALDEMQFMRKMGALGRADYFMNSFCVVAGGAQAHVDARVDRTLYGAKSTIKYRAPRFGVETRFGRTADGALTVTKTPSRNVAPKPHRFITHVNRSIDAYHPRARSLQDLAAAGVTGRRPDETRAALQRWADVLAGLGRRPAAEDVARYEAFSSTVFGRTLYAGALDGPWIDGAYFDLIPSNVMIADDGAHHFIDLEWQLALALPLQFVVDHGLIVLSYFISSNARHAQLAVDPGTGLLAALVDAARGTGLLERHAQVDAREFTTWFEQGVYLDMLDASYDEIADRIGRPDVETFIERVAALVRSNRTRDALAYADRYRPQFPESAVFERFDQLVHRLRASVEP